MLRRRSELGRALRFPQRWPVAVRQGGRPGAQSARHARGSLSRLGENDEGRPRRDKGARYILAQRRQGSLQLLEQRPGRRTAEFGKEEREPSLELFAYGIFNTQSL